MNETTSAPGDEPRGEDARPDTLAVRTTASASLRYLGQTMVSAAIFSRAVYSSGVGGKDCKGPQEIFSRIMFGLELGIAPMAAVRELHVVNGRVGMSARLMHALARKAGVRVRYVESTDTVCRVEITPPGEDASVFEWTIDRAQKAGLLRNDVWRYYPAQMLRARAVSEGLNATCPDVLQGGMHSIEELQDVTPGDPMLPAPTEAGMKEKSDKHVAEFNRIFAGEAADPFAPPARKKPVDASAPDHAAAAPTDGDAAAPAPATEAQAEPQPEPKAPRARKGKAAQAAPTQLDNGEFAMMRAITQAAERKRLVLIDGRIDVEPFGGQVGLDHPSYSPKALAMQTNAAEILAAIEAYEEPTEGGA